MAIIIQNKEDNTKLYRKILLSSCFITVDGVYVQSTAYFTKAERDKEKDRIPQFEAFIASIAELRESEEGNEELAKMASLFQNFERAVYSTSYISEEEKYIAIPEEIEEAKKYGFQEEWYTDPILRELTDIYRVGDYNKQDFDLKTMYEELKSKLEEIYGDRAEIVDDL